MLPAPVSISLTHLPMADGEKNALNSMQTPAHPSTPRPCNLANPGTLGLFSFASTTLILSLYNAGAHSIHTPNLVVGMAAFCGGLAQLLAGMWEFPRGNTFAATAFTSYGAFWMSFATILIPGSGIVASYKTIEEFNNALAIYLITWFMVTFFLFIAALRKSVAFIALFGFLFLTFILLAAATFLDKTGIQKGGGILGCITAMIAYYIGLSELLASEKQAVVKLPLGVFPTTE